ncbi:hypothetical protein KL905_004235 [Ogataea polymorpha]|uniref:Rab-GAP TBC domain-containing protein n=1 Tax=Ogataea polymorpha TaxID=460523 RepID=A0A9P8SYU7_9ASCO|nr:hypothetical protein KL906_003929 [Ogataea polymorpha]KAG7915267.1 hypothetical protein KL927_004256 [Ogataea polymorpha]KAG7918156.1 hypothetical protein KL905_004235 [Ogataea polymorpha]KAG7932473.1 hypothetical protein KL934_003916 [Ogataea polymorpha]KAH3659419.1 hypothetical protein OGATHE_006303 [Ogataea polymorpha]
MFPPSLLEVIQESFEDVPLDETLSRSSTARSLPRKRAVQGPSTAESSSQDGLVITPSQRLRLSQKKRAMAAEMMKRSSVLDTSDFLSDDELPDDLIVYNVPYTRPLRSLSQHEQAYRPSPLRPLRKYGSVSSFSSFGSPKTRASSIFSASSDLSELSLLEDDSKFSDDACMLTLSEDPLVNESLERIAMLNSYKHLSAPTTSKEKLNYLTVTRQTNLPPKDPREASKHTRDYQQLLQTQIDQEQKKMAERKRQLEQQAKQTEKDRAAWRAVLRNYDSLVCLAETRELWWRGVPADLRVNVWIRQMGRTELTDCEIVRYLNDADDIINKACDFKVQRPDPKEFALQNNKNIQLIKSVEKYSDLIQQAFPNLLIFQFGQAFDSILKVMLAFNLHQRESGNRQFQQIQLTNLVNLICVLYYNLRDEKLTLRMFVNLVSKKLIFHLLVDTNNEYLEDIAGQFDKFLAKTSPAIHAHFKAVGVQPLTVIANTVPSLFSKCLNMDVCSRLVDIYIFEGDTFPLRVLLALIRKIQYKLLGSKEEICNVLGHECLAHLNRSEKYAYRYLDVGDAREFIADVRTVLRRQSVPQ